MSEILNAKYSKRGRPESQEVGKTERIFARFEAIFLSYGLSVFLIVRPGRSDNKKGEGRFSFTFLRRDISPATL